MGAFSIGSRTIRSLLWIDSLAGLTVGVAVLVLSRWLSALYALPPTLVIGMGMANAGYGLFSLSLARRAVRPMALLRVLVLANALWAVVCAVTAVLVMPYASFFGLAQLLLEGVFVGGLAVLEWRHRASLLVAGVDAA